MELIPPKEITANNQFPSSCKFIGGEKEKVSICLQDLFHGYPPSF